MAITQKTHKTAILGGGLAGLTVAALLEKAGHDYVIVEAQADFGGLVKGQTGTQGSLDYGLKSVPVLGELSSNPLIRLKEELGLSFQIESFNEATKTFENNNISDFVGFGESKDRQLIEELSYYTLSPRLLVAGGWQNLVDQLSALIPEKKKWNRSIITKIETKDDAATSVSINGDTILNADNFIFTLAPSVLKEVLPLGSVSGKILQRIARTIPHTMVSLDLATKVPTTDAKNIFVLKDQSKKDEEAFYVIGQFVSNIDPARFQNSPQVSTWMTLVDAEHLADDENGSKTIRNMKKIIKKAFPQLIENSTWERLLVVQNALGQFEQLTLEKNKTLPGITNMWICGGKTQNNLRNVGAAINSSLTVAEEVLKSGLQSIAQKNLNSLLNPSAESTPGV